MTKILNFVLKIKGGGREGGTCEVLRPCHPSPQNLERAPLRACESLGKRWCLSLSLIFSFGCKPRELKLCTGQ